jgi:RNA ligase
MCRGLVLNDAGEIIVLPLPKFFNHEQSPEKIPFTTSEYVYIQEKMDGSLGILFWYENEWIFATRGSFTSDQCIRGTEILNRQCDLNKFVKGIAYICEIIYPSNRIVVDYGDEEMLMFMSATTPEAELNWSTAKAIFHASGIEEKHIVPTEMRKLKKPYISLYNSLKKLNTPNREGFVLRFMPSNYRRKIKFDDYLVLHRIMSRISSYTIWESLMLLDRIPEDVLTDVPDEFYDWVKRMEKELRENYNLEVERHIEEYDTVKHLEGRELAEEIFKKYENSGISTKILFCIKRGSNFSRTIWQRIKPAYTTPFKDR